MTTYHAMSYFTYNLYGLQGKKVVSKHVLLAVLDKQNLYELAEMLLLTFICLLSIFQGGGKLLKKEFLLGHFPEQLQRGWSRYSSRPCPWLPGQHCWGCTWSSLGSSWTSPPGHWLPTLQTCCQQHRYLV